MGERSSRIGEEPFKDGSVSWSSSSPQNQTTRSGCPLQSKQSIFSLSLSLLCVCVLLKKKNDPWPRFCIFCLHKNPNCCIHKGAYGDAKFIGINHSVLTKYSCIMIQFGCLYIFVVMKMLSNHKKKKKRLSLLSHVNQHQNRR